MPTLKIVLYCCILYISACPVYAQMPGKNSTLPDSTLPDEIKYDISGDVTVISLDDNDLDDGGTQNISSVLNAGKDPFLSAAAFNFSAARFRIRGYDADFSVVYMNGAPVYNIDNGFTSFGLWGGLNGVMRNREVSMGLGYNNFAFGNIQTTTSLDCRAIKQRKQTSFSYAASNRSYMHRWMFTHSTGMNKKGWAFSFSGSRRWANEGYAPGTYYDGWSFFAAVDKRLNEKNLVSFVVFGTPTESGRQSPAFEEMIQLSNNRYYNSYWGYQNGKKRNANVGKIFQPVSILTHELKINNNTSLITAAGYSIGKKSISGLDWYNAPDPRPDYYRYLPSYQTDAYQKEKVYELMQNNETSRQINWQNFYNVNRENIETIQNANGAKDNAISGHRSLYVLQDRVTDTKKLNINSVVNTRLSDHADFTAGVSYQWQKNNYFQQVNDLLGGEFYVDLNQFAERDFPNNPDAIQNDLNNPNRILRTGDKYGYNYDINITRIAGWLQNIFRFNHIDLFLAYEVAQNKFYRTGNVKNGLFPDDSYGKSTVNNFINFSIKGGITYKINGRNYLYANAGYLTRPPYFDNVYISPRTRNTEQDKLTSETIQTLEGGYILNAPKLKLRLSGYYTSFKNGLNILTFYHETYRGFVNYALSNIGKIYFGGELGFDAKIIRNLSITGAASVGRFYYNSRQHATVTSDNTAAVIENTVIYSENFRLGSTPQEAYSFGLSYRPPKSWFISITGNYFNEMWLDFNPVRRTYKAVEGIPPASKEWHAIIDQVKFNPQYTVDCFGGYSWRLSKASHPKRPVYLGLNYGINNLLNNKNLITGGYEQLRFDFDTRDPKQFPPKYYYAYGLNYFLSATIRY